MNLRSRNRLPVALLVAVMLVATAYQLTTGSPSYAELEILADVRRPLPDTTTTSERTTGTIDPARVVKESWPVNTLPEVALCNGGPDYPNRGGVIDDLEPYPTPADALFVFVLNQTPIGNPHLATFGYIEMVEPGGAITFGQEARGNFFTLISVVEVDGQWAVDRWDASGC